MLTEACSLTVIPVPAVKAGLLRVSTVVPRRATQIRGASQGMNGVSP